MLVHVDGTGRGAFLKFNKLLPDEIGSTITELEEIFHQLFKQITYFQERLDQQQGKAASALRKNLNSHLELMGKSAPALLNFTDVMKSFMAMIEATDEGGSGLITPTGRAEIQYSLSSERIEMEVKLEEGPLKDAATSFQTNLLNMDELFTSFDTMINEVISGTNLPWDDFSSLWNEAQNKVKSITEETKNHIDTLLKEVDAFVKEIVRVDQMASKLKVAM